MVHIENNLDEIWLPVRGYEDFYEVSNWGRVRSLDRVTSDGRRIKGRILKIKIVDKWACVRFVVDGIEKTPSIARLVYDSFVGELPDSYVVSHKDGNCQNNIPSNLYVISRSEQMKKDVIPHNTGTKHYRSRLTPKKVKQIRQLLQAGYYPTAIARKVGTTRAVVRHIKAGTTHK